MGPYDRYKWSYIREKPPWIGRKSLGFPGVASRDFTPPGKQVAVIFHQLYLWNQPQLPKIMVLSYVFQALIVGLPITAAVKPALTTIGFRGSPAKPVGFDPPPAASASPRCLCLTCRWQSLSLRSQGGGSNLDAMHPGPEDGRRVGTWGLGTWGVKKTSLVLGMVQGWCIFPIESPMNHPIANICHLYITYSPCQLGDYI